MKKSMKLMALAVAAGICLLLTGCYVSPDDDTNGDGGNGGSVVSLVSPTPNPTSTTQSLRPDESTITVPEATTPTPASGSSTVVVLTTPAAAETAGTQPTVTDVSGSGSWSDWGSGGATSTTIPVGEKITLGDGTTPLPDGTTPAAETPASTGPAPTTPAPTTPIVTPTPTPPSLQIGFKGSDEVRALQKRLKELGYYNGSVDGDFGEKTEKAVKEFQSANGLKADGKVGEKTKAILYSKKAKSYKEAHATPTPKPTAKVTPKPTAKATSTPNLSKDYYLRLGDSGKKVETLQRRLIELGWLDGNVTGNYDAATEAAVIAFQRRSNGLWDDGVAGPATLRALYSSGAARTSKAVASSGETLEFGSEGEKVRKLQQKLKDLGYLSGTVDGKFGVATEAAVIAFQRNNNLTADGKAGTATLSKLYSGSANRAGGSAAKIDSSDKNKSGRDTSNIASTGYVTLELGSTGEQVRKLQRRLKDLGYYNGSVDGSFGEGTEAAVMAFQLQNRLTVDGKAGPATQRVLYGTGGNTPVKYSSLREGDSSDAVRNLQYTLYELGYYDGSIDGDYGPTTADAVRAFQIQNNLKPVDGVAGSATLSKLYSSDAKAATAPESQYQTVQKGDEGEDVVLVQDCLVQMGYLSGVTGVYDDATVAAVKEFQQAHGLTPDGKAGQKTLMILFGY